MGKDLKYSLTEAPKNLSMRNMFYDRPISRIFLVHIVCSRVRG